MATLASRAESNFFSWPVGGAPFATAVSTGAAGAPLSLSAAESFASAISLVSSFLDSLLPVFSATTSNFSFWEEVVAAAFLAAPKLIGSPVTGSRILKVAGRLLFVPRGFSGIMGAPVPYGAPPFPIAGLRGAEFTPGGGNQGPVVPCCCGGNENPPMKLPPTTPGLYGAPAPIIIGGGTAPWDEGFPSPGATGPTPMGEDIAETEEGLERGTLDDGCGPGMLEFVLLETSSALCPPPTATPC